VLLEGPSLMLFLDIRIVSKSCEGGGDKRESVPLPRVAWAGTTWTEERTATSGERIRNDTGAHALTERTSGDCRFEGPRRMTKFRLPDMMSLPNDQRFPHDKVGLNTTNDLIHHGIRLHAIFVRTCNVAFLRATKDDFWVARARTRPALLMVK